MTREEFERMRRSETGAAGADDGQELLETVARAVEEPLPEVGMVMHEGEAEEALKAAPPGARMAGTIPLREMASAAYGLATAEGIVTGVLQEAEQRLSSDDEKEAAQNKIMVELCRKALDGLDIVREKIVLPVLRQVAADGRDGKRQREARRRRGPAGRRNGDGSGEETPKE